MFARRVMPSASAWRATRLIVSAGRADRCVPRKKSFAVSVRGATLGRSLLGREDPAQDSGKTVVARGFDGKAAGRRIHTVTGPWTIAAQVFGIFVGQRLCVPGDVVPLIAALNDEE